MLPAPATGAVSRTYRVITDMLNREKCGINRTYCIKETCFAGSLALNEFVVLRRHRRRSSLSQGVVRPPSREKGTEGQLLLTPRFMAVP